MTNPHEPVPQPAHESTTDEGTHVFVRLPRRVSGYSSMSLAQQQRALRTFAADLERAGKPLLRYALDESDDDA